MADTEVVWDDLMVGSSRLARPLGDPQWVKGDDGDLCLIRPLREPELDWYSPLEDAPEMNAVLAQVEPTEESIAAFVADYGWLGVFQTVEHGGERLAGESLEVWDLVLSRYRILWGAVAGKPELGLLTLRKAESFTDSEARAWQTFYWWLHSKEESPTQADADTMASENRVRASIVGVPNDSTHEWSQGPRSNKVLLPGHKGVVTVPQPDDPETVAGHARDKALAQALEVPLAEGVGATLGVRDDGSGVYLRFSPKSVLAAAYMQIARDLEAAENLLYAKCPTCLRMYKPSKRNPKQRGCGRANCRTARYALRRDEAYRLRTQERLEPSAIAARMEQETAEPVTITQVNGWIQAAMKRKGKHGGERG